MKARLFSPLLLVAALAFTALASDAAASDAAFRTGDTIELRIGGVPA